MWHHRSSKVKFLMQRGIFTSYTDTARHRAWGETHSRRCGLEALVWRNFSEKCTKGTIRILAVAASLCQEIRPSNFFLCFERQEERKMIVKVTEGVTAFCRVICQTRFASARQRPRHRPVEPVGAWQATIFRFRCDTLYFCNHLRMSCVSWGTLRLKLLQRYIKLRCKAIQLRRHVFASYRVTPSCLAICGEYLSFCEKWCSFFNLSAKTDKTRTGKWRSMMKLSTFPQLKDFGRRKTQGKPTFSEEPHTWCIGNLAIRLFISLDLEFLLLNSQIRLFWLSLGLKCLRFVYKLWKLCGNSNLQNQARCAPSSPK